MLRLAKSLGFNGFEQLKAPFRDRLVGAPPPSFEEQARVLQSSKATGRRSDAAAALVTEAHRIDRDNLRETYDALDPAALDQCVRLISSSRDIRIVGLRSAYAVAFLLHYTCRSIIPHMQLIDGTGGTLTDGLRGIGDGGLLIACSFAPYARETVEIVEAAYRRGAGVVAITDSKLSPLAMKATVSLEVGSRSTSFFQSFVGAVSVAQLLVTLLIAQGGKKTLEALAESEEQLQEFSAYWMARPRRPGPFAVDSRAED
jgi:DNA-binding MurR/RpiR family transcriptional regulator